MAKMLIDKLLEKNTKVSKKKVRTISIALSVENFEALDKLSKATKTSKSKIVNMALEEVGAFDIEKIDKKLQGVGDVGNS